MDIKIDIETKKLEGIAKKLASSTDKILPSAVTKIANRTRTEVIKQLDKWVYDPAIRARLNKRKYKRVPTGTLRRGVIINKIGRLSAIIGPTAKYASALELGKNRIIARLFMQRSMLKIREIIPQIIKDEILKNRKGLGL